MSSWQFKPVSFGTGELIDNHDGTVSYKVEEGNTLGSLADEIVKKTGQKREKVLADLVRLNGIKDQNVIEKNTPYKFPKYEKLPDSFVKSGDASADTKAAAKDAEKNTSLRTSTKRFSATVTSDPDAKSVVTSPDKSIWDVIAEQDAQRTSEKENETFEFGPTDYEALMMDNPEFVERILKNPDKHSSADYALALRAKAKMGAAAQPKAQASEPAAAADLSADEAANHVFEMEDAVYESPNLAKAKKVLADPSQHSPEDVAKAKAIFEKLDLPLPDTAKTLSPTGEAGVAGANPAEAAVTPDEAVPAARVASDGMDDLKARDIIANPSRYASEDVVLARDHFTATGETELAAAAEEILSVSAEAIDQTSEMLAELTGVAAEDIKESGFAEKVILFAKENHPHHPIYDTALSQMDEEMRKDALKAFPSLRDMAECDDKDNPGAWALAVATKGLHDDYTVELADKTDAEFTADQRKLAQIFALFGTSDIDLKTLAAMASDKKPNGKNKSPKALREDRARYAEIAKLTNVPDGSPAMMISEIIGLAAYRLEDPTDKTSKHIGIAVVRIPKSPEQIAKDKAILAELELVQHLEDVFSDGQSLFTPKELLPVAKGEKTAEQMIQEGYGNTPERLSEFMSEIRKPYKDKGKNIDKEIERYEADPQAYVERRVALARTDLTYFLTNAARLKGSEREAYAAAVKKVALAAQELTKLHSGDTAPSPEDKKMREAAVVSAVEEVVKALEKGAMNEGGVQAGNAYDPRETKIVTRTLSKDAKALLLYRLTEAVGGENVSTSEARLADKITAEMGEMRKVYYAYNVGLAGRDEAFNRDLVMATGLSAEALGAWKPNAEQAAAVASARTSDVGVNRHEDLAPGTVVDNQAAQEPYDWSHFDATVQDDYDAEVLRQTLLVQAERDAQMALLKRAEERSGEYGAYDSDMALLRQGIKAEAELRAKTALLEREAAREMERSEAILKLTRRTPGEMPAEKPDTKPAAPVAPPAPTPEEIRIAEDIKGAMKEE